MKKTAKSKKPTDASVQTENYIAHCNFTNEAHKIDESTVCAVTAIASALEANAGALMELAKSIRDNRGPMFQFGK
jgi:hypothetical protein